MPLIVRAYKLIGGLVDRGGAATGKATGWRRRPKAAGTPASTRTVAMLALGAAKGESESERERLSERAREREREREREEGGGD